MAKTETRFGTFEEMMDGVAEPMQTLARKLRDLVYEIDPDAVEVTRLGDNATVFGIGPRKMKEGYCYIMPHKKWVNFGVMQGGVLDDPAGLLEGTGAKMRHIKVRDEQIIGKAELRTLIEAAIAERRAANK